MIKVILLISTLLFFSCKSENNQELKITLGNYGHLDNIGDYSKTPMILSLLPKDTTYKVCLSNSMAKKFPGIEEEIKAAINIWAYYINRNIDIKIAKRDLRIASSNWSTKDIISVYKRECGANQHIYISEQQVNEDETKLGYTTYRAYTHPGRSKDYVSSFQRLLMLSTWNSDQNRKFVTLKQVTNKDYSAAEILETLKSRDKTIYTEGNNQFLTLTTLVHEFGHVWGLCDQYPLEGNTSNCDPRHSTLSPHGHIILEKDAIMSSANWHNPIMLHKDDIEGIIDLASRQDLAQTNWARPSFDIRSIPTTTLKDFEYGKIINIESTSTLIKMHLALHTNSSGRIKIETKISEDSNWSSFANANVSEAVNTANFNFNLRINSYTKVSEIRITFIDNSSNSYLVGTQKL